MRGFDLPIEVFDKFGRRYKLSFRPPVNANAYFNIKLWNEVDREVAELQFGEKFEKILFLDYICVVENCRCIGLGPALLVIIEDCGKQSQCSKILAHVRTFAYKPGEGVWLLNWYVKRGYKVIRIRNESDDPEYLGTVEKELGAMTASQA
ncbi:MAG TPA: hypothetical protein VHC95_06120 [Opitutales bacterium]|nr:hypothetical protein [Opitutales bacterium]